MGREFAGQELADRFKFLQRLLLVSQERGDRFDFALDVLLEPLQQDQIHFGQLAPRLGIHRLPNLSQKNARRGR